jgi:hypothetical protein
VISEIEDDNAKDALFDTEDDTETNVLLEEIEYEDVPLK